jgi:hypothetical protein
MMAYLGERRFLALRIVDMATDSRHRPPSSAFEAVAQIMSMLTTHPAEIVQQGGFVLLTRALWILTPLALAIRWFHCARR